MARSYGQIMSAIWNSKEFKKLSRSAQWAYMMMVTQADISSAGALPLTIRRWSGYASDSHTDSLSDSLSELEKRRYIVVDEATEELLVRTFVKWDGGYSNPKRQPAIISAANSISSAKIRQALAIELDSLGLAHSLSDSHTDRASDSYLDSPRVVVTEVSTIPEPKTTTHNPEPEPVAKAATRASRLPANWRPSPTDVEWSRSQGFDDMSARRSTEKFCDYWRAESGAKARKLDWSAAWRNWLRRDAETPARSAPLRMTASQKAESWLTMPLNDERKALT